MTPNSEIVPEMTAKLKKNTESDIINVLKLPQQEDEFFCYMFKEVKCQIL